MATNNISKESLRIKRVSGDLNRKEMIDEFQQMSNRRSLISRGGAMIGTFLLGTAVTSVKEQTANVIMMISSM